MKLNFQRETLLKPLQSVIGVVERKQTMQILSNVLLNTSDNQLSITGTDLEIELIGHIPLDLNKQQPSYQLTLPGRKLIDICKALPEDAPIELHQEKGQIILRSGKSRFTLATLPAEDFPNFEQTASQLTFNIPTEDLRFLLKRTYFAMAEQDVRYYLNGMLFEIQSGLFRVVATDGHRLTTNCINVVIEEPHRIQIIVPRKAILELIRLLDTHTEVNEATVIIGNNYLRVKSTDYTFTTKLIEGRFPDYNRVIPKNPDKKVIIVRDLLKHALNRAAILSNEKVRGVFLEFRSGMLRIFANNAEHEAALEEMAVDYSWEDLDLGFNVNYLIDVLNCINTETVILHFSDAVSSMRIDEEDSSGNSIFIVMPMRM